MIEPSSDGEDSNNQAQKERKEFLKVKSGIEVDESWFTTKKSFKKPALDDLAKSLQGRNLQFEGDQLGIDLDSIRRTAFKADRD